MSMFKEQFVENPEELTDDDVVINIFQNERFDIFAIFVSGRVFKKRARGQSGAYDNWMEVDLKKEIKDDLKI